MRSSSTTRSYRSHSQRDGGYNAEAWEEPPKPKRDWKKALLVLGLGTLSWVATYVGMLELIQSNMGDLPLTHKIIIGFSVAMLMTMIIWLLDQLFAPLPLATKLAYVSGYVFLTLISVGFGFGFYWKVLESRSEASRSAESAVTQVKTALYGASARLDQLQTTLGQLTQISAAKAVEERERGTTCPNSRPGDGPRRRLRDADAARFGFAAQFVKGRAAKSKSDMNALDVDLKKIASSDPSTFDPKTGTRNKFLQALTRRLELTATGFNAFRTDPQLRQIRSELAERSAKTQFPTTKGGTFSCPDPQLQSALRGVVRAIDQLPELGKPQIATVEGAQAVIEAFRRLTTTFYGVLTFKLPPSADELRALQQKAVQSVENAAKRQAQIKVNEGGLSKRDYIPLAIALFVDLCLLLVSIGRPMNRLHGLIPKMKEAERGPVYQILSRFDDIHRNQQIRERFEVFRHVVFDFNGDYYVAVPLDAPRKHRNPEEVKDLQQEAHLLGNLFASFEKEKIFSRVQNPLLTRKTIKKKLYRQGSKFAESEAFRTYRFRDGAWSEIILGAVMGASRAMPFERQEPMLHHEFDQQPNRASADHLSTQQIHETLENSLRRTSGRYDGDGMGRRTVDPMLREKYGRYADSMTELPDSEPHQTAPGPTWPYRKPEVAREAEVDLHVAANSNTSPNRKQATDPDNVIPLPSPRTLALDPSELPDTDAAANRIEDHEELTSEFVAVPVAQTEEVAAEVGLQPPPLPDAARATETEINVRITERTADITVPVTDAELPQRILHSVGRVEAAQLNADRAGLIEDGTEETSQPMIDPSTVDVELVEIPHADADSFIKQSNDLAEETKEIAIEPGVDDPFMRVAQRFAAGRTRAD